MKLTRGGWVPFALAIAASSPATTKGLNQIVTPDIQGVGSLSLSAQIQHQMIGNSEQVQYELGLSKNFEVAAFQGLKPGAFSVAAELGLVQTDTFLVSTGFLGWSSEGDLPQVFLEGGYYKGRYKAVGGVQRAPGHQNLTILGASYQLNPNIALQSDYLSGDGNYTTFGFTYSPNARLSINPALYMANSSDHKLYPYMVVSYTIQAFKG